MLPVSGDQSRVPQQHLELPSDVGGGPAKNTVAVHVFRCTRQGGTENETGETAKNAGRCCIGGGWVLQANEKKRNECCSRKRRRRRASAILDPTRLTRAAVYQPTRVHNRCGKLPAGRSTSERQYESTRLTAGLRHLNTLHSTQHETQNFQTPYRMAASSPTTHRQKTATTQTRTTMNNLKQTSAEQNSSRRARKSVQACIQYIDTHTHTQSYLSAEGDRKFTWQNSCWSLRGHSLHASYALYRQRWSLGSPCTNRTRAKRRKEEILATPSLARE